MRYYCNECKEYFNTKSWVEKCIHCGSERLLQLPSVVESVDGKVRIM